MTAAEILRAARDPSFWRDKTKLAIGAGPNAAWSAPPAEGERSRLREEGWARIERIVPVDITNALAAGIRALHEANIPTPLVYVFDEPWQLAAGLLPTFDALVGAEAHVVRDIWAWLVPVGSRGWAPHRGVPDDIRDAHGGPSVINVWMALTDVTEQSACMNVVPIGRSNSIALPVPAGSLIAWNANVLHWGGAMEAGPPRISLSFTLQTMGARPTLGRGAIPTFEDRLDLAADMLVTYANVAGIASHDAWLEWARLWRGMRNARQ